MWTILQAIGLNKWIVYGMAALAIGASITTIVLRIRANGAQSEKLRQAQEGLSRMQRETRERAKIESMSTAAARKRLRDKWSSRS